MYVERVPNRSSKPTYLLRAAQRQGRRVVKRTLANLSAWPPEKIEALRRLLADKALVSAEDAFAVERTLPHGHVEIILAMIHRLGLERLIASRRSRQRDLVVGMIVERLIHPASKLDTTRLWQNSTLAEELELGEVDVDQLYAALDWLLDQQSVIEGKLAKRHLIEGGLVLYDVSSSYYFGSHCKLAQFGHSRDRRKGLPIIVYGLLTDPRGRPVSVQVYAGNTADPTTVPDQVTKVRERFGLERVVLVGDRGMLTHAQIDALRAHPELGWISCLRSTDIQRLIDQGTLQLSLFDTQNLAELRIDGENSQERLIACFNPLLAAERRRKREELLVATERDLEKIARDVRRRTRTPLHSGPIGLRVGRVLYHYKMGKHFRVEISDGQLSWSRRDDEIKREAALDGIYVIRTSEPAESLAAADAVRNYKSLSQVERAFRSLKGLNNRVRPIFHRTEPRVRAHVLLCMLTYYVEWHLLEALAPLLYKDAELAEIRKTRDPVAPAKISESAQRKKQTRQTDDGLPLHTLNSLLDHMSTRTRVWMRVKSDPAHTTFSQLTEPNQLQRRAMELIQKFPVR